jgi:hypothetical protein
LSINEAIIICMNSSAPAMWLIIFVNHSMVIICVRPTFYFNTILLWIGDIVCILFKQIILKLSINIVNNYWLFFLKCFSRSLRDLRIFIKKRLAFVVCILSFKILVLYFNLIDQE